MTINDVIYGRWEINEPVLIELLNSPSVTRLKNISQFAIPVEYHEIKAGFSRFEHSVGVMLLLRMLNASLEEQVTGLLHDVSHTAFSHLIDLVVGDGTKEDYQDNRHYTFIKNSELPKILEKYGLNVDRIANHKEDSLLEKELPDICADRVDYGLREMYYLVDKKTPVELAKKILAIDNRMVFDSKDAAKKFAFMFLDRQKNHWGSPSKMFRWHIFSQAIKSALSKGIIRLNDFDRDDNYIMDKLINSNDPKIRRVLTTLRSQRPLNYQINESKPLVTLKKKFRYVDPLFVEGGDLKKYSKADLSFMRIIEEEKSKNTNGVALTFEYEKL